MKAKVNIKNIISYLQGNLRYKLFYSNFAFLIPNHIREQIEYRINSMDIDCYEQGQCIICGCKTTALQMANKACDKPCYPTMETSKLRWNMFKKKGSMYDKPTKIHWTIDSEEMKFYGEELGTNIS